MAGAVRRRRGASIRRDQGDVNPGPPSAQDSADSLQAAEAWIEAEPLAGDSEPATGGKPRKRKKKISFV